MPVYFASDVHLRLDRPDRARRLRRWVDTLAPDDALYLVGDVCDFWFASRQARIAPLACDGLNALAAFRNRGGSISILPGNHDLWLGPYYERVLGARILPEPQLVEAHGRRFWLVHGHRAGGRRLWKAGMESHPFLKTFGRIPGPLARRLDGLLDRTNESGRERDEARTVKVYRRYLEREKPEADVAVFGHVHSPLDDPSTSPRMVILGGWHERSSYLRVDDQGARLIVRSDDGAVLL